MCWIQGEVGLRVGVVPGGRAVPGRRRAGPGAWGRGLEGGAWVWRWGGDSGLASSRVPSVWPAGGAAAFPKAHRWRGPAGCTGQVLCVHSGHRVHIGSRCARFHANVSACLRTHTTHADTGAVLRSNGHTGPLPNPWLRLSGLSPHRVPAHTPLPTCSRGPGAFPHRLSADLASGFLYAGHSESGDAGSGFCPFPNSLLVPRLGKAPLCGSSAGRARPELGQGLRWALSHTVHTAEHSPCRPAGQWGADPGAVTAQSKGASWWWAAGAQDWTLPARLSQGSNCRTPDPGGPRASLRPKGTCSQTWPLGPIQAYVSPSNGSQAVARRVRKGQSCQRPLCLVGKSWPVWG